MAALRLANPLKELRIHLCQKSEASKGIRAFIEKEYVPLKKANPNFPILIRECRGVTPRVWARYEFGKERCVTVADYSPEQVLQAVQALASQKTP